MSFYYRYAIIETYRSYGESSRHSIRARPLPGQGLSTSLKVECSSSMRERAFTIPVRVEFGWVQVWTDIRLWR